MRKRLSLKRETVKRLVEGQLATVWGGTHRETIASDDYCMDTGGNPSAAAGTAGAGCPVTTISDPT